MIRINKLSYCYSKKRKLFDGLTLELLPGKIYGLLGKNGAGKSTLIKNIGGMLFPTAGSCDVFGHTPGKRQRAFLAEIFYIPEEYYLPRLTIRQLVDIYAPYYSHFNREQFTNYLIEFGIKESRHTHGLSFGQKKKVLIGFALSSNTRVLIMDEPTNGLDIPSKITFRNMIKDAFTKDRIVILSTHQVRDLDELITSLIVIDKGEVLLQAEKEELEKKLHFNLSESPSSTGKELYQEKVSNGWAAISENISGEKSYLDIELLFNAVLDKEQGFNEYITTENSFN